ncbi:MAG: hypothetical protein RLZZ298_1546 [Pseudomonadota bacterium]|jgi:hypothetical protein
MNVRPIETAHDQDLRLSMQAMQRAARRAHEIARQTNTPLVVSRNGTVEFLSPEELKNQINSLQEPVSHYQTT